MDEQTKDPRDHAEERGGPTIGRILGITFVAAAVVAALYLLVGYFAWESGQTLRDEREQEMQAQQQTRQVSLAQDDIKQGSYDLALRRLEWVLEKDPANEKALALREQAQAALKTALTPVTPPTPTAIPDPTVRMSDQVEPEEELARLQRLHTREQWEALLPAVQAMQRQFPGFERMESDRYLYDAYLNLGLQQIRGDQIEQGINNLTQAERLGDLPQEALDYWYWGDLYLEGIAYYGVNWAVSSSVFRDLCLSAPFFQNACDKLFESLVGYGDQYLFNEDYCPAVDIFREARQYGSSATLGEKLSESVEGCTQATPTPAAISGTLSVPGTEPLPLPPANE